MKNISFLVLLILAAFAGCQYQSNTHMTYILENKNLEIQIDLPLENYQLSRFDWTGKITAVKYKGVAVSGFEKIDAEEPINYGKGFYNEFGIDDPIAFDETKDGDYFHKIGIGLLKKEGDAYLFSKPYEIKPAEFNVTKKPNKIMIECTSQSINGYSYVLKKEIELLENGFRIDYYFKNTGEKTISTNEYTHNFLAIDKDLMGRNYILKFPFQIKPELFGATVNTEGKVEIGQSAFTFNGTPNEQFFFSNLSANEKVEAYWELINTKSKIGISEKGSFETTKINLWGWKHVISPELFFDLKADPNQTVEWSITYRVFEIDLIIR